MYRTITTKVKRKVKQKMIRKFGKLFYRNNIEGNQECNNLIKAYIESGQPFMVSRLGGVELNCIMNYLDNKKYKETKYEEKLKKQIKENAGVFSNDDKTLDKFSELYISEVSNCDILGLSYNYGEDLMCNKYAPSSKLSNLIGLEPYYYNNSWSLALEGKKVLVIHPYEESIQKQFLNKNKLFNPNILPDFELITIKAVQSIANNKVEFKDWFEAYDSMCKQIDNIDFDIAIIGAGAYGLPLASYCKKVGKQAIHLGGPTQILFGIKGKRWDNNPGISQMYNEYWIRPSKNEIPQNHDIVENGCYW